MGMFDWVKVEVACPQCGGQVKGFQTKSGECTLSMLKVEEARWFYSGCDKCNAWVECEYIPPQGVGKLVVTGTKGYFEDREEFGPGDVLTYETEYPEVPKKEE